MTVTACADKQHLAASSPVVLSNLLKIEMADPAERPSFEFPPKTHLKVTTHCCLSVKWYQK
jgi:hypothetical protein